MISERTELPVIVGIGASAGGLEALEHFFQSVKEKSGLSFIVIQHLDPTQKDLLPEILQRSTWMPVSQAADQAKTEPDCVYIIPPNKNLSVSQGVLYLVDPVEPRGQRLPIDFFFDSLAADQQQRAVAVILSGMGSDGTKGARAIKEKAGSVLVQSPETAGFDSMPIHVINAGLADIVASPSELPGSINSCLKYHQCYEPPRIITKPISADSRAVVDKIISLLQEHTGNDFSLYKRNTIYRRIDRRMDIHQIKSVATYYRYLSDNPNEIDLLFNELLIGVTSFFRDVQVWDCLAQLTLPELLANSANGRELRAWVPACSTGEEAYSLAMVFCDLLDVENRQGSLGLQIFATDLDEDSISFARRGVYPNHIESDVPKAQLNRYFTKVATGYRINKKIRDMVVFARQNIISDPPFTKLDILCCRNLLIYFDTSLQQRLIPLFHYSLVEQGVLLLGNAETVGSNKHLFEAVDKKSHIYKRIDHPRESVKLAFPTRTLTVPPSNNENLLSEGPMTKSFDNLQTLADKLLLRQFSPPSVLINAEGDILYINGRTGKYLEPAAGKANWNIYAMIHDSLRHTLEIALTKAKQESELVKVQGEIVVNSESTQGVEISAQVITAPEELSGLLFVLFTDFIAPVQELSQAGETNQQEFLVELQQAREMLNRLREEKQISQDEAKSAYEELQSTNEELQSTNEELTTSKEEMQSMNEELQTLNNELHSKVDDLTWVNNDMTNLLNSTEIATLFLDNQLNVRRFTSFCTPLFRLIETDIGRPLSDIVTELRYPDLQQDAIKVLNTLVFTEKQVMTESNSWYKVRIMPYRTQENVIDGVVITLIDIKELKAMEKRSGIQGD